VRETVAVVECDRRFASEDFPLRFKNPAKDKADFPYGKERYYESCCNSTVLSHTFKMLM